MDINKLLYIFLCQKLIISINFKISTKYISKYRILEAYVEYENDDDKKYFLTQRIELISQDNNSYTLVSFNPLVDRITFLQKYIAFVDETRIILVNVDWVLHGWKINFVMRDLLNCGILKVTSDLVILLKFNTTQTCKHLFTRKLNLNVIEQEIGKKILVEWNDIGIEENKIYKIGICFDSRKCLILFNGYLSERIYIDGKSYKIIRKRMRLNFHHEIINSFVFIQTGTMDIQVSSSGIINPELFQNIEYDGNTIRWRINPFYYISETLFFEVNKITAKRYFLGICEMSKDKCTIKDSKETIANISPVSITFSNGKAADRLIETWTKVNFGETQKVVKLYFIKSYKLPECGYYPLKNLHFEFFIQQNPESFVNNQSLRHQRSASTVQGDSFVDNLNVIIPVMLLTTGFISGGIALFIYIKRSIERKNEFQIFY